MYYLKSITELLVSFFSVKLSLQERRRNLKSKIEIFIFTRANQYGDVFKVIMLLLLSFGKYGIILLIIGANCLIIQK